MCNKIYIQASIADIFFSYIYYTSMNLRDNRKCCCTHIYIYQHSMRHRLSYSLYTSLFVSERKSTIKIKIKDIKHLSLSVIKKE